MLTEDPAFYASLQMALPDNLKLQEALAEVMQQWRDIVGKGDRAEFIRRMSALQQAFSEIDPRFREAYAEMYRLTEW